VTGARYHRHNLIDWFSQEALAKARVAVIGAGAIGNEVIKNLALLGTGEIHVFDLDTIEEHNLTRSVLFRDADIGQPKAAVAARRAMELDGNISATAVQGDVWDRLSLSALRAFDVLFCCVDNFETRIRCNLLCYLAGVDFVNTGIDSRSAVVELYPFSKARAAGCLECNLPKTVYARITRRHSCGHLRKVSFVERKVPTTIITSAAAASLAVSRGLRLGAGGAPTAAQRFYMDTIAGSLARSDLARDAACPCCGRFSEASAILTTRPAIGPFVDGVDSETTVVTSEPILVSYRIAAGDEQVVFDRASAFSSDFAATLASDPGAVELEIRDQFTLGELARRFSGREMPCKFASVFTKEGLVIFDFEGMKHERCENLHPDGRSDPQS
jgi:molybdopterin/thiamine biosynthesis adenylyltransferase